MVFFVMLTLCFCKPGVNIFLAFAISFALNTAALLGSQVVTETSILDISLCIYIKVLFHSCSLHYKNIFYSVSCLTGIHIPSSHFRSTFLCRSTEKASPQPAVCIQRTHRIDRSKTQHAPLVKGNPFASISQKLLQGHISAYTPVQEHRQIKEVHFKRKQDLKNPSAVFFTGKSLQQISLLL